MTAFVARRLIGVLPVILGVSIVIFLLVQLAPGDAATVLLGPQATEAAKAELRQALGLDQSLPMQYLAWLGRTLTGDFGKSIATQLPVASLVLPRFVNTLILTFSSLLLAIVIGYSVGLFAALRARSLFDRTSMSAALLAGSAPPFWLGLILVLLFAIQLRWLPVSGMQDMADEGERWTFCAISFCQP
jgi:peptide/nickel transport system permease protein